MTDVLTGSNDPFHPEAKLHVARAPAGRGYVNKITQQVFGDFDSAVADTSSTIRNLVGEERSSYTTEALQALFAQQE